MASIVSKKHSYDPLQSSSQKKKLKPFTLRNAFISVALIVIGTSYLLSSNERHGSKISSKKPLNAKFEYYSSEKHDGVIILGAPQSGLYLVSSLLSSAGFRLSSNSEPEGSVVLKYTTEEQTSKFQGEHPNMEPFERVDSFGENNVLLADQNFEWKSTNLDKFNNTLARARIRKDNFLKRSNMLTFLDGKDEKDVDPWLWQDPQMCVMFPAWIDALEDVEKLEKKRKMAAVVSYQHPLQVAKSLHANDSSIPIVSGLRLWLNYNYKCFSNIHNTGICTVYTSQAKLLQTPAREVNRLLRQLELLCDVAPGPPGKVIASDAKKLTKQSRRYEELNSHKDEDTIKDAKKGSDDWHNQIIIDSLGIWSAADMDCGSIANQEQSDTDEKPQDYGSPMLASAINELTHLEDMMQSENEKEEFRGAREAIFVKLQRELALWMGDEIADAIGQLVHQDHHEPTSVNKDAIRLERTRFFAQVRSEIRIAFSDAMNVFCSLENGDALKPEYRWPQQQ